MRYELSFDAILLATIAFGMSLARTIVSPNRRGLLGFLSALLVAMICGWVAGVTVQQFGVGSGGQYITVGFFAVMGEQCIFAALAVSFSKATVNNNTNIQGDVHGDVANNFKKDTPQ